MNWFTIIFTIILIIGTFVIGWLGNEIYHYYSNNKFLDGLWIPNRNWTEALKTSYNIESGGNWVCINSKGMNYEDIIKTCEHETAHELFARECEKDIAKCIEIAK